MKVCTFFGHRECYGLSEEKLCGEIEKLIHQGVDTFYVGNQGNFDAMVRRCLKQLCSEYPHIHYSVVLAYLPGKKQEYDDLSDAIYPEGIELEPPRFAIARRNRWMTDAAEYCLCFVDHTWGGAYKFAHQAKHRGRTVINLGRVVL